jgi:hypothetical protein
MKPHQRELLRLALLRVLETNATSYGLGIEALRHLAAQFGFPSPKPAAVALEIQYLEDKGFVLPVNKVVSPENRAWRISAAGRDSLAQLTGE